MSTISLKRIARVTYITFGVTVLLLFLGALRSLLKPSLFGLPGLLWFFLAAAVIGLSLFLSFRRFTELRARGESSGVLRFIDTVHRYRFLMEQLVTRDFKIKYKRSVLGVFWSFLNPLLMMVVQYIVFSQLLGIRGNIEHYAIYLLSGIVMWNGFNDCSTQSMRSITGNATLITKVYVPKYIYPITKVFSASINVLLSMLPLLLVTLVYGLFSTPRLYLTNAVLLLPFGLIFLLIFCVGMGFLLSALMVFFRDIEFLWGVIASVWMYATPIIYSLSMFEGKADWLAKLMQFNPLYHYITFVRTIILDGASPALSEFAICLLFSAAMFFFGYGIFRKLQDRFILYL